MLSAKKSLAEVADLLEETIRKDSDDGIYMHKESPTSALKSNIWAFKGQYIGLAGDKSLWHSV